MGVVYYLVVKDIKNKLALIIELGKYYDDAANDTDVDYITTALDRINDTLNDIDLDIKVQDLKIKQLAKLAILYEELNNIIYSTNIHTELIDVMKVYGLVKGLVNVWHEKDFEWEIMSEYQLFEHNLYEEEGYKMIWWGC